MSAPYSPFNAMDVRFKTRYRCIGAPTFETANGGHHTQGHLEVAFDNGIFSYRRHLGP